jgi:hypothetical protein
MLPKTKPWKKSSDTRTVNPQVPGSSPGRGATEFVADLGLSPATPAGLLSFWDRNTESPRVGIGGTGNTLLHEHIAYPQVSKVNQPKLEVACGWTTA